MNEPTREVNVDFPSPAEQLKLPLASLSSRLLAAIIDGVLIAVVMMIFLNVSGGADAIVEFSQLSAEARADHEVASVGFALKMLVLQAVIFVALNLAYLQKYGQTIGKRVMKIAMVNDAGLVPPLHILLIHRYLSQVLMGVIPGIGAFLRVLDIALIFRRDRRCLHDMIAKTSVVDVSAPPSSKSDHLVV